MKIIILRHAESLHNLRQTTSLDSTLSLRGINQAHEAANFLKENFDFSDFQGLTSPYYRTLLTASIVAQTINCPFSTDWLLREWGSEISHFTPETKNVVFSQNSHSFNMGHAEHPASWEHIYETKQDLVDRCLEFKEKLYRTPDKNFIVVSHGMTIYTLINVLQGINEAPEWKSGCIPNSSITYFEDEKCVYLAKFVNSGEDPRIKK